MKKLLVFGASNSKKSINKVFAMYAADKLENIQYELLDLNDYEMPIYSVERETESGIPSQALDFKEHIKKSDGIIISFAEHNGNFTASYKNIYDWVSRINQNVWENKAMLLLSTSPGKRGGSSVLNIASSMYSLFNTNTVVHFSLPSFYENFRSDDGIIDETLQHEFKKQLNEFGQSLQIESSDLSKLQLAS